VGPIAFEIEECGVRQQQRFCRRLDRLNDGVLGCMGDIAYHAEPVTGLDHLGAKRCQSVVRQRAGLEIADVVRRIVHQLCVPHAALVRLFQPFELPLEEIEPLDVHDDGWLPHRMRRLEIGSREGAAQPMVRHYLVRPGEALEMMAIELARLGRAHRRQNALRIPPEDRTVRHICKAGDREGPGPHGVGEIVIRRRS
jgi:hypothetical protein